ncbi:MAG TPA: class I SAM-dependent methyltransferase [Thermomicrobiaceae bacterium]|nr:class I SAM-dependent methyltransferase [Thermomicrobiaceae bacterium]
MAQPRDLTASATGQRFTAAGWLDVHFEALRPEYEAQLRAVGIQPGWRVLDAACGSGSFLPWLAELVGPTGNLSALDLAPDNVAIVERRLADWDLPCPVEVRVGNVLALPYPDDTFDALWFANTSQYLTDAELATALAEFRRVVRPGGLIAVKEADVTLYRVVPAPAGLLSRWAQARARSGELWAAGCLRASTLPGWLRRAGLQEVPQRTTLIERAAPLDQASRAYLSAALSVLAVAAVEMGLPADDQDTWARLGDPTALAAFLDDPECCITQANILVVGTVPT